MNRKEPPLSICESNFILEAIREGKRLDGREVYDYRSLHISLGEEPGHVEVRLGGTRVLARASCEVVQPRPQRPTEGQLFFNVEFSPMASPGFEIGRPSSQAIETGRILERCFKESRAIDTESLCIIAGEKVWSVRIDLHVLDHCGNIIDCAAIAAIAALKHFRRPDVTVIGEEATIHPITERDPVPLSIHHMPLCITFGFFWDGDFLLVDPTHREEAVMDGRLVVGMNIHRELCALQMAGGVAILPEQVLRCSQIAAVKCAEITDALKRALSGTCSVESDSDSILSTKRPEEGLVVPDAIMEEEEDVGNGRDSNKPHVTYLGEGTAELGVGGASTWLVDSEEEGVEWSNEEEEGGRIRQEATEEERGVREGGIVMVEADSSSEEEATVLVTEREVGGFEANSKTKTKTEAAMTTKRTESITAAKEKRRDPDSSAALKTKKVSKKKKPRRKSQQKLQT